MVHQIQVLREYEDSGPNGLESRPTISLFELREKGSHLFKLVVGRNYTFPKSHRSPVIERRRRNVSHHDEGIPKSTCSYTGFRFEWSPDLVVGRDPMPTRAEWCITGQECGYCYEIRGDKGNAPQHWSAEAIFGRDLRVQWSENGLHHWSNTSSESPSQDIYLAKGTGDGDERKCIRRAEKKDTLEVKGKVTAGISMANPPQHFSFSVSWRSAKRHTSWVRKRSHGSMDLTWVRQQVCTAGSCMRELWDMEKGGHVIPPTASIRERSQPTPTLKMTWKLTHRWR